MEKSESVRRVRLRAHPRRSAALKVFAVLAVAGFLYVHDPSRLPGWVHCPFHALTGLFCPGCGTLRALHALMHGQVGRAFGLNALTMTLLPFVAYPFLSTVLLALRGRGLRRVLLPDACVWLLVAAILVFWVLRNLPVHPFTVLAP